MAGGSRARGSATRAVAAEIAAVRTRRKKLRGGSTQEWLAQESGIPKNTIKSIEIGRAPIDIDQLFAIADALGVRPSDLIGAAQKSLIRAVASSPTEVVTPPSVAAKRDQKSGTRRRS